MIQRDLFNAEHEAFRDTVRRFIDKEIAPYHESWEEQGLVPRDLWLKAGAAGMLCCTVPEQYGGLGVDYLFDVVVFEEMARSGFTGPGFLIHCDLVATYIKSFGTEAQKQQWLPKMVRGEAIGSLGMTEPHAGSDLKAIRTRAVRDGDDYIISGQKVFISNGQLCDVIVLATKTDSSAGAKGVTLFLVDTSLPGFRRGKNLKKLGMKGQDTSEMFFDEVRVPASAMLGEEGQGFSLMMTKLAQERLEKNMPVPGYKLVSKRATRQWADESKADAALAQLGIPESERRKIELISPAQAEKVLKKSKLALPDDLVIAVSSGSTLAPASDPRPAVLNVGMHLTAALSKLQ